MMSSIETKVFTHNVEPTDTLQGIAVKYSVSVERLKKINKLWSNDSFHVKETLLIPYSEEDPELMAEPTTSLDSFVVDSYEDHSGKYDKSSESHTDQSRSDSGFINDESVDPNYCRQEYRCSETMKDVESIFSKIDNQIKEYKDTLAEQVKSDGIQKFNEMLSKIDNQIQAHKEKNPESSEQGYHVSYKNFMLHEEV